MKTVCYTFIVWILLVQVYHSQGSSIPTIIDLTWPFNKETIYWPGNAPFNYTKKVANADKGFWYAANEYESAEHVGTHLDAPYHFNKDGWKVGDIPINRLIPNGMLLDFTKEVEAGGPDYLVDLKIMKEKMKALEPIPNNTVLLIKLGWSKYWHDEKKYMGMDTNGIMHFPGLDNITATFIASNTNFVGIGTDTASGDAGMSQSFSVHQILLGKCFYILENTKLDENLPEKNFRLSVAPMKLEDGTGAPVRIFAILDEK